MIRCLKQTALRLHILLIECALAILAKKSKIYARLSYSKTKKMQKYMHMATGKILRDNTPDLWFALYRNRVVHKAKTHHSGYKFSVVLPVSNTPLKFISEALASVRNQTHQNWELLCVDDGSQNAQIMAFLINAAQKDARIHIITLTHTQGAAGAINAALKVASGDYIVFMDQNDVLEPHALLRLSDAAMSEASDVLYSDEVITSEHIDNIISVQARPAFSYDYYMSHPYIVHPVAVKTSLVQKIGGLNTGLNTSPHIDYMLRILEVAEKITHIPDILYRWRNLPHGADHPNHSDVIAQTCAIKAAHLQRLGFEAASVAPGMSFNTYGVTYFEPVPARILAIIPTRDQVGCLRVCVDTLLKTTVGLDVDIVIIDHESREPDTLNYLDELVQAGLARVLPYRGKFNYSQMNNHAVQTCGEGYDLFLFLNNDIEALKTGWLEAMTDLARRGDVGAVGATLLYPDGQVQHSGVLVGTYGTAEHTYKFCKFDDTSPGYGSGLHATRDCSAVTAACMLVPADVFRAVNGFDETLEVGFGDTDLCLRIGQQGYRILNCACAVLVHHESVSRGKSLDGRDPHPSDTVLFKQRYEDRIKRGDPFFSPLLDRNDPKFNLGWNLRSNDGIAYRTVTNFRPKPARSLKQGERAAKVS